MSDAKVGYGRFDPFPQATHCGACGRALNSGRACMACGHGANDVNAEAHRLRTRLQRAEELLQEASFGFHQHKASLLDYCPRCRERVRAIDAFLTEDA